MTEGTQLDARAILSTPDLIEVGVLGDEVRRRLHGNRTTFVRVFEVHVDAPPAVLPPARSAGEVRIVGTPAGVEPAVEAVKAAVSMTAGRVKVTGFSLTDLIALCTSPADFKELCRRLHEHGLTAIADTPLDAFLGAADASARVEDQVRIALAERLRLPRLTVHAQPPSGEGEIDARIAMVERADRLGQELGGFAAFAPLPRSMSVAVPTTGYADVRQIALARVAVSHIPSIQVDWPLYGPKLAQVALTVGADDIDGVSAVDTGALGSRRSPLEEIKNNIRAAALEPTERDASFEPLT